MIEGILALLVRIISNPLANAIQKLLAGKYSAVLINLASFGFLSLFCAYPAWVNDWSGYGWNYWGCVALAGVLCTIGSICLIKALQIGEMSVLGPINSYKCLVGLVFGYLILGETPSIAAIIGVVFIVYGSWFIFDTVEEGFSFKILLRKDVILRFCALFCTGCEAVVLKKIILMSSVIESFILWCFSGAVFSLLLMFVMREKFRGFERKDLFLVFGIAVCLGLMQYSTNMVFKWLDVGLSLALFQLSSVISVIFGYLMFREGAFLKKLLGTAIMILGSALILIN